ncbi:MAG TPA: hypothetical protein VL307_18395 [Chitinophagaceae bacterium]|nr:hypothetical protein [Chitinophagaceae bacterium]
MMQPLLANTPNDTLPGVYLLRGVMETASVFELKPDSSFEFFFSQGALDRGGRGRWTVKDGKLLLNSIDPRPPKDYALVSSKTIPGALTVIKMVDKNSMILSYSDITLHTPNGPLQASTNSRGEVVFKSKNATAIELLFRLCPDRSSSFSVSPGHNYFEFRLEPWIADVFFNNFELQISNNMLTGQHPLLQGTDFTYEKESAQ